MSWLACGADETMLRQLWLAVAAIVLMGLTAITDREVGRSSLHRPGELARRLVAGLLTATALFAGVTYFYSSRSHQFLHRWDLFHTTMTTRYLPELGYDKLYECSIVLDAQASGHFRTIERFRDLTTLRHVSTRGLVETSDCESRFSPERRAAFLRDLEFWWDRMPSVHRWQKLFGDKGYNGTPVYTAEILLLVGDGPFSERRLKLLATLDVVLILAAFGAVGSAFGVRVGLFAFLFFCVNFPNRFTHMGGSILRFDYVAALIASLCMLGRRRYGPAGALLAVSSLSRGFPVLFAAGLGLKAVYESIRERRIPDRYLWFFGAFLATAAIGFAFSLTAGGLDAWAGFIDDIRVHTERSGGFRIGFRHLFMLDGNLTGSEGFVEYFDKAKLFAGRKLWYWLAAAAFLAPTAHLVRKLDDLSFTAVFGLLAFFVLLVATRYYYSVLVVAFLLGFDVRRHLWVTSAWALLFAMSICAYAVFAMLPFEAFVYNTLYGAMLAGFFIFLLASLTMSAARRTDDFRRRARGET